MTKLFALKNTDKTNNLTNLDIESPKPVTCCPSPAIYDTTYRGVSIEKLIKKAQAHMFT